MLEHDHVIGLREKGVRLNHLFERPLCHVLILIQEEAPAACPEGLPRPDRGNKHKLAAGEHDDVARARKHQEAVMLNDFLRVM